MNDEITIETYNEKVSAAKNAIENVVLVYGSQNKSRAKHLPRMSLDEAWRELQKVNEGI